MEALIVHYNTPEMTAATVRSIWKHTPNISVTIMDNSGNYRGPANFVLRNHIDFKAFLDRYPNKLQTSNEWGSAKHCYSVDYCFRYEPNGFILLDSDVLVKRDIAEMWDPAVVWSGQVETRLRRIGGVQRLLPYLCYINVPMCKDKGIRYFEDRFMWRLNANPGLPISNYYDTGAFFLDATKGLPHKEIPIYDYIVHYGSASFKTKPLSPGAWLEEHSNLYI